MNDRSFVTPNDDGEEWHERRDALVAQLRSTPRTSKALQRFTTALAHITDPGEVEAVFTWLERRRRSH